MTNAPSARLTRPLVVALGLFAAAIAVGVAAGAVGPIRPSAVGPAPRLPDMLLALRYPSSPPFGPTRREVLLVRPEANAAWPLLEGAAEPLVAPDGRTLYFVQHLEVGDEVRTAVVALASDTLERLWGADVAARPADQVANAPFMLNAQLAATADRVYVASHLWQSPDPITVVALDRADGRERARWRVDFPGLVGGFDLFATPDGTRLDLLAALPGPSGRVNPPPAELHQVRLRLPDGQEEARHGPVASAELLWNGRMSVGGRSLFASLYADQGTRRQVLFLDLATGAFERLDLPFRDREYLSQEGLSHDGRRLYVFAPALGEVGVVDLVERRIEQTALVDVGAAKAETSLVARALSGLGRLLVGTAVAKSPVVGALQLSPDGRRLYAVGVDRSNRERPDGVWVIDTASWRVADRWLAGIQPARLLLSVDGRHLYVQDVPPGTGTAPLRVLDTATGAEVAFTDQASGQLFSVAELYRDTYGRSPVPAAPAEPRRPPPAAMAVAVGPDTAVGGDEVAIELRFVGPVGGRTVEPGQPDVRYEPPARVIATLEARYRGDRRTVQLMLAGYGVYRGRIALPAPTSYGDGVWSARVVAEWSDGLRRRAGLDDAVVVQRPFEATDRRRYVIRVATDPVQPLVDRPATVRAMLVDAETGAPLPAGAAPLDGLPEEIEASFFGGTGVTTAYLRPAGHGVYEGALPGLWSPGAWRVWAALTWPGRPYVSYAVGSVQAVR